jgi:signal transduction histidine kinase
MIKVKNDKLVTILSLGFATILLLISIFVAIAFDRIHVSYQNIDHVVNNNNFKTNIISNMRSIMRERILLLQKMLIVDDPFLRDEIWQQFNHLGSKFIANRLNLNKISLNDIEKNILENLGKTINKLAKTQRKTAELALNGNTKEPRKLMLNKGFPLQDEIMIGLEELLEIQRGRGEQFVVDVRKSYDNGVITMGIIAIALMFICIIIAVMIVRRTSHTTDVLRIAKEEAEEANEIKSQFIANISHELRTPLNAIIGYSEILMEEVEEEAGEELQDMFADLGKINSSGLHLLNLINDVLDISKIESGRMKLSLESFRILDLCKELSLSVQSMFKKRNNNLECHFGDKLGYIHADLVKTRQILLNLLNNASKFTENGNVTFIVKCEEYINCNVATFIIQDDGIGISKEQNNKLFKVFSQIDGSSTRIYGGTGLGLAICKKFANMMHGDIKVKSELNNGSTFTLHIPLVVIDDLENTIEYC